MRLYGGAELMQTSSCVHLVFQMESIMLAYAAPLPMPARAEQRAMVNEHHSTVRERQ